MTGLQLINPMCVDDAEPWLRSFVMTIQGDPHSADMPRQVDAWRRGWRPERTWGVLDRGVWVATLATTPRTLTVPAGGVATSDLTVDAVTAVAVAATHRRRGLLTEMLSQSVRAAKQRGEAVSILIAAEASIYGRYGYAPATVTAKYRFHPRQAGPATYGDPTRVRQVHRSELGEIAPVVFDAARRLRAGQIDRRSPWWERSLGLDDWEPPAGAQLNWFVHDGPDGPDGLLAWKVTRQFDLNGPLGAVEVDGPVAMNDAAYRDFWAYLSGMDAIDQIDLDTRPVDEPIRWLLSDPRALKQVDCCDFLWLRLLDVPVALAARRYAAHGRLVLDVSDAAFGGLAAGRYALSATSAGSHCVPTDEAPDIELPQRTLAAIYLGGHRLHQLALAGDVREHTAGTLDLMDLMFSSPLPPWTQTWF